MELAKSGGIMLFIISKILSKTRERKWIKNKWVEKKTLEDVFDELERQGIEIYAHCEFDEPWPTFDADLAWFVEVGFVEIESFLVQLPSKPESPKIVLEEKAFILLTGRGKDAIKDGRPYFKEHEEIIEKVINDIVANKN